MAFSLFSSSQSISSVVPHSFDSQFYINIHSLPILQQCWLAADYPSVSPPWTPDITMLSSMKLSSSILLLTLICAGAALPTQQNELSIADTSRTNALQVEPHDDCPATRVALVKRLQRGMNLQERAGAPGDNLKSVTQTAVEAFIAFLPADLHLSLEHLSYWQLANAVTSIILHDTWSAREFLNDGFYNRQSIATRSDHPNYIVASNNDTMWWAIAMLEYYEMLGYPDDLTVAQTIAEYIDSYVLPAKRYIVGGNDMAGAVLHADGTDAKIIDSVTAGLYAELSARLASLEDKRHLNARRQYIETAIRSLSWVMNFRYDVATHLVLDHIDLSKETSSNSTYTYATGQAIAAMNAVYRYYRLEDSDFVADQPTGILSIVSQMARAAMSNPEWVDANGVLKEPAVDANSSSFHVEFAGLKSILIRSLAKLYRTLEEFGVDYGLRLDIQKFIRTQYHAIRQYAAVGDGRYGPSWEKSPDNQPAPSLEAQWAVLDVMAAIHLVEK